MTKRRQPFGSDPQDAELAHPLHTAFVDRAVEGESDLEMGRAIQALIEEQVLQQWGLADANDEEKQRAISKIRKLQSDWDTDAPALLGPQAILKRLGDGRYAEAVKLAEGVMTHRQSIGKGVVSKIASDNAKRPRLRAEAKIVIACIEEIFLRNPRITATELRDELRRRTGNGVIDAYDDDDNTIFGMDGSEVAGSLVALESRLKRMRQRYNKK